MLNPVHLCIVLSMSGLSTEFSIVLLQFSPELVLVSCGFDAAEGDPLGGYSVTPAGYSHMTHLLLSLAHGKVVSKILDIVKNYWATD